MKKEKKGNVKRDPKGRFKPGQSGGPGRPSKKRQLTPVISYLMEVLEDKLPEDIILRLADNLTSKTPTTFLNSLKLLLSMAPQARGRILSPHVLALLQDHFEDVITGEGIIEDLSKLNDGDDEN